MGLGYLFVAVVAVGVTVFALQNGTPIAIRFVLWRVENVPVAGLVLGALGAGLVIAGLPLWIARSVWRARARGLEARVAALEATVLERDRQLLRMPPQGGG